MSHLTLAQSLDPKYWLYLALLMAFLVLGAVVIFALRRKLFTHEDLDPNPTGGGLLEHLDSMLEAGSITKEEYDQTRKTIIDKATQQMDTSRHDESQEIT